MTHDTTQRSTVVGVFPDRSAAERTIEVPVREELRVDREGEARVREGDTRLQE